METLENRCMLSDPALAPGTPTGLAAHATGPKTAQLSWVNADGPATGTDILISADGTDYVKLATAPAGSTDYTASDLLPTTTYQFELQAVNGIALSPESDPVSITTRNTTPDHLYNVKLHSTNFVGGRFTADSGAALTGALNPDGFLTVQADSPQDAISQAVTASATSPVSGQQWTYPQDAGSYQVTQDTSARSFQWDLGVNSGFIPVIAEPLFDDFKGFDASDPLNKATPSDAGLVTLSALAGADGTATVHFSTKLTDVNAASYNDDLALVDWKVRPYLNTLDVITTANGITQDWGAGTTSDSAGGDLTLKLAPGTYHLHAGFNQSPGGQIDTTFRNVDIVVQSVGLRVASHPQPTDFVVADKITSPDLPVAIDAGANTVTLDLSLTGLAPNTFPASNFAWLITDPYGTVVQHGIFDDSSMAQAVIDVSPPADGSNPNFEFFANISLAALDSNSGTLVAAGTSAATAPTVPPAPASQPRPATAPVTINVGHAQIGTVTGPNNSSLGKWLDPKKESGTTIYLPEDNFDEDGNNKADNANGGPVTSGDSMLIPVRMPTIPDVKAAWWYTTSSNVKLLTDAQASSKVSTTLLGTVPVPRDLNADAGKTFYLQGTKAGAGWIKFMWYIGTKFSTQLVNLTVFNGWTGARDVPGNGAYTYTATGLPGQWTGVVTGGKVKPPTTGPTTGAAATTQTVAWTNEAAVGTEEYKINDDYTWDYLVNVVKITVGPPPQPATPFTPKDPIDGGILNLPDDVHLKSLGNAGMDFKANISFATTPFHSASVKKIRVGFIQNLAEFSDVGTYTDGGHLSAPPPNGGFPMLDAKPGVPTPFYPTMDPQKPAVIYGSVSPQGGVIESWDYPPLAVFSNNGHAQLISYNIRYKFILYVCAYTTDEVGIYAPEATASWGITAVGRVDGNLKTNPLNPDLGEMMKTDTPQAWMPADWTTNAPKTTGEQANTYANNALNDRNRWLRS